MGETDRGGGECDETKRENINKCILYRNSQFLHEDGHLLNIFRLRDADRETALVLKIRDNLRIELLSIKK